MHPRGRRSDHNMAMLGPRSGDSRVGRATREIGAGRSHDGCRAAPRVGRDCIPMLGAVSAIAANSATIRCGQRHMETVRARNLFIERARSVGFTCARVAERNAPGCIEYPAAAAICGVAQHRPRCDRAHTVAVSESRAARLPATLPRTSCVKVSNSGAGVRAGLFGAKRRPASPRMRPLLGGQTTTQRRAKRPLRGLQSAQTGVAANANPETQAGLRDRMLPCRRACGIRWARVRARRRPRHQCGDGTWSSGSLSARAHCPTASRPRRRRGPAARHAPPW